MNNKAASEAYYGFLAENEEELDRIYDELVKVRTKIAKSLGFKNFVELGYARMYRTDYNAEMVANYRQQVLDYIVPVTTELRNASTSTYRCREVSILRRKL